MSFRYSTKFILNFFFVLVELLVGGFLGSFGSQFYGALPTFFANLIFSRQNFFFGYFGKGKSFGAPWREKN
jgi:hypothetical protein